jgi:hypothetical protein
MAQPLNRYGIEKRILENESGKRKYRQGKMLKKYVRIANAVLDLDPFESGKAAIDNDQIAVGIQRMDRNESSLSISDAIPEPRPPWIIYAGLFSSRVPK